MERRFTIIQGGASETRCDRPLPLGPAVAGWRVALRRPIAIGECERVAWQALAERHSGADPFAHPDYLLTTARHGGCGAQTVLAFAFAESARPEAALAAVLPLTLPHAVRGGSAIRPWQPPLSPRPVRPLVAPGSAPAVLEAILRHLNADRPRTALQLESIPTDGELMCAVTGSHRLEVRSHAADAVPAARFVAIGACETATEFERITDPERIREAVERFLLLDAKRSRRPLVGIPGNAAILREVTRLFAKRGEASVEFGLRDGAPVSAAVRLGRGEKQVLWRNVNAREAMPSAATADLEIRLSGHTDRDETTMRPRLATI